MHVLALPNRISFMESYAIMPKTQKKLFKLRVGFLGVAAMSVIAIACVGQQRVDPVAPVITVEDARQDEKIDQLTEFRHNQENFNTQQGAALQEERDEVSTIKGIGIGAFSLLAALQTLSVILQLGKKKES